MALEAVFAPVKFKLLEKDPVRVTLDPDILRRYDRISKSVTIAMIA